MEFRGHLNTPVSKTIILFCDEVTKHFKADEDPTDITDRFFKCIEDDTRLLTAYRKLEKKFGRMSLNAQIGRWIKDSYTLNNGEVVPAKLSTLITAYTTHSTST
jgi:hypothetical protein